MFSAARIQAIRKGKGYSQELLAEESGVSLRTIQRVEQGETVPRGHTVQALATALGVSLEAFRPEPAEAPEPVPAAAELPARVVGPGPAVLRADPELVQLLNLSALSFLLLPLLNIVVPLWLWRRHRRTTAHVAEVGRRVLGFQVLWQVGSTLAYLLLLVAHLLAASHHWPMWRGGYLELFIGSYALNVLVVGYSAVQLRRGNLDVYPVRL